MEEKENKVDVKFINSIALAVHDVDENIRHVQITIVQETDSKKFNVYFDVIDPSKVKLSEPAE